MSLPTVKGVAYDMHRVFHLPVFSKLALHILITKQSHLSRQMLPVSSQKAAVQRNWWQQGHWSWAHAALGPYGGGRGQEKT